MDRFIIACFYYINTRYSWDSTTVVIHASLPKPPNVYLDNRDIEAHPVFGVPQGLQFPQLLESPFIPSIDLL